MFVKKVWGEILKVLRLPNAEIDLLYLERDTACSIHKHSSKFNLFLLLQGDISVKTDLGTKELRINEPFVVEPNLTHQFIVHSDSTMLEIAYVNEGTIEAQDIVRKVQGGKFINGKFYTLDQLKDNNWLEYDTNK